MEFAIAAIIIALLITLAFGLSFSIGANDETSAPLVAAGTLKLKFIYHVKLCHYYNDR